MKETIFHFSGADSQSESERPGWATTRFMFESPSSSDEPIVALDPLDITAFHDTMYIRPDPSIECGYSLYFPRSIRLMAKTNPIKKARNCHQSNGETAKSLESPFRETHEPP